MISFHSHFRCFQNKRTLQNKEIKDEKIININFLCIFSSSSFFFFFFFSSFIFLLNKQMQKQRKWKLNKKKDQIQKDNFSSLSYFFFPFFFLFSFFLFLSFCIFSLVFPFSFSLLGPKQLRSFFYSFWIENNLTVFVSLFSSLRRLTTDSVPLFFFVRQICYNGVGFPIPSLNKTTWFWLYFCYEINKLFLTDHQNYVILLSDGVRELTLSEHIRFSFFFFFFLILFSFYSCTEHITNLTEMK